MSKGKILSFDTHGNEKQKETARLWLDKTTTDIVYGGSKGCQTGDTLIQTIKGLCRIDQISVGDTVLTVNEKTGAEEWKPVKKVLDYSTQQRNEYHKLISFITHTGEKLTYTPNHEFYIGKTWVAAGEFARRVLDIYPKHRKEIHDFNPGKGVEFWTEPAGFFESYYQPEGVQSGVSVSGSEEDFDSGSPIGCITFFIESGEKAYCKPCRLQQGKQSGGKSGVGDRPGECTSFQTSRKTAVWKQKRGKKQQNNPNRRASFGDQEAIQEEDCNKGNAWKGIWSKPRHNKGRCSAQELDARLISEIRFELMQGVVYDLHVADNHNYCVTEGRYIVHNSGKSFLGCNLIFGDAFMYPETRYFIARKTGADLRKHTIPSIQEVFGIWGIKESMYKFNGQDNYYTLRNGSQIYLLDAAPKPSDPHYYRFGSMQMTRGWIEEAGEFEEGAKNNLAASIGRWKNDVYGLTGKLLQTCNPAKNYLYREYYRPHKENTLPDYRKFVQALPTDNKKLPDGYLENLNRILNANEKERLLFGNWEYDDDPTVLIEYDNILNLFENRHVRPTGQRFITADIARFGRDCTVIMVWDGFVVVQMVEIAKSGLDEVERKILALAARYDVPVSRIIVDEDGVGGGVKDTLRCKGFVNNSSAIATVSAIGQDTTTENYANLKSQCYFKMAEKINMNEMHFAAEIQTSQRERLIADLEQVKQANMDKDTKKAVLSKDKVKELLGRSPDFSDALMMRMYFTLQQKRNWFVAS